VFIATDSIKKRIDKRRRCDMSETSSSGCAGGANRTEGRQSAALRAADWLCLAAAPTFAIMAVLTGVLGSGQPNSICSAAEHTSTMSGMIVMYFLMSAFQSTETEPRPPVLRTGKVRSDRSRNSGADKALAADLRSERQRVDGSGRTNGNRRDIWT
jgi:hypothetical protein